VANTFSLNYSVNGTPQTEINNDATPTTFKVDRLVNVTVASQGNENVSPNETNATLDYTVTNDGNDTHAYLLSIEEVVNGTGSDNLDTDAPTSGQVITYSIPGPVGSGGTAGAFVPYDPANPPVLAPDVVMTVRVTQDVPSGATDGDQADVVLLAETRDNVTGFPATTADNDTTNSTNVTENVLADAAGDATGDTASDATHSDTGSYLVVSADVTATKDVFVLNADYDDTCPAIPGAYTPPAAATRDAGGAITTPVPNNGYNRPGACVEYFITVTNAGTAPASALSLVDNLPSNLIFRSAALVGSLSATTETYPGAGTDCAGPTTATGTNCEVSVSGGTLPAGSTGHLVIRATIE
jgi:uncharacterized repeat protein (TIGR01451 family)